MKPSTYLFWPAATRRVFSGIACTSLAVEPLAEASHIQILRLRFAGLRVPVYLYVARVWFGDDCQSHLHIHVIKCTYRSLGTAVESVVTCRFRGQLRRRGGVSRIICRELPPSVHIFLIARLTSKAAI